MRSHLHCIWFVKWLKICCTPCIVVRTVYSNVCVAFKSTSAFSSWKCYERNKSICKRTTQSSIQQIDVNVKNIMCARRIEKDRKWMNEREREKEKRLNSLQIELHTHNYNTNWILNHITYLKPANSNGFVYNEYNWTVFVEQR